MNEQDDHVIYQIQQHANIGQVYNLRVNDVENQQESNAVPSSANKENFLNKSNNQQEHWRSNPSFKMTILRSPEGHQSVALFDYDRDDYSTQTLELKENVFVYRSCNSDTLSPELSVVTEQQAKFGLLPQNLSNEELKPDLLAHIRLRQSQIYKDKNFQKEYYYLKPQKPQLKQYYEFKNQMIKEQENKQLISERGKGTFQKKIFTSIKNSKGKLKIRHQIKKNDQFRFGLEDFKVVEIDLRFLPKRDSFEEKLRNISEKYDYIWDQDQLDLASCLVQKDQVKQGFCKFCLTSQTSLQNPLFSPCLCKGSCSYVHLLCLRAWLNVNLLKNEDQKVSTYTYTKYQCQICKFIYPLKLKYRHLFYSLIQYQVSFMPYFILERIRPNCNRKKLLIVKAFITPISIGRTNQNDIQIMMNSVSRKHACIEYANSEFYLKDLDSKFGTLVRVKQSEEIRIQNNLRIECGDMLITFNEDDER